MKPHLHLAHNRPSHFPSRLTSLAHGSFTSLLDYSFHWYAPQLMDRLFNSRKMPNISPWCITEPSPSQIHRQVSLICKLCSSMPFWPLPLLVPATSSTLRTAPSPSKPATTIFISSGLDFGTYWTNGSWIKTVLPKKKNRPKKEKKEPIVATGAVQNYEEWIPQHHLKKESTPARKRKA